MRSLDVARKLARKGERYEPSAGAKGFAAESVSAALASDENVNAQNVPASVQSAAAPREAAQDYGWEEDIRQRFMRASDTLKIAAWNVNGLRSTLRTDSTGGAPIFERYLLKEDPDLLFCTETKLNANVADQFAAIEDFEGFHECHTKPGYAGVAFFFRRNFVAQLPALSYRVVEPTLKRVCTDARFEIFSGLGDAVLDCESRVLTLFLEKCIVVGTYVLNAGMKLRRLQMRTKHWDKAMFAFLRRLAAHYARPIVWTGDLNIAQTPLDIWNSKANQRSSGHTKEERASFACFLEDGEFVDIWRERNPQGREYTFWPTKTARAGVREFGWRIDLFVVHRLLRGSVRDVGVRTHVPGSDHAPIVMELLRNAVFDCAATDVTASATVDASTVCAKPEAKHGAPDADTDAKTDTEADTARIDDSEQARPPHKPVR